MRFARFAVALTVVGGFLTPGYDPMRRTISRLAVSGLPAASVVEVAICTFGIGAIGLAIALGVRDDRDERQADA